MVETSYMPITVLLRVCPRINRSPYYCGDQTLFIGCFGGSLAHSKVIWGNYCEDRRDMLSIGRSSSSRVGMLASLHVEIAEAYLSELMEMMHSMACV